MVIWQVYYSTWKRKIQKHQQSFREIAVPPQEQDQLMGPGTK
jgi:hypothetical protein